MSNTGEDEVVTVTSKGQATIPKRFRERLGIETPGRVRFRENARGEVVLEALPTIEEFEGVIDDERTARELLDDARSVDEEREARLRRAAGTGEE